jgi:hypothetical protein
MALSQTLLYMNKIIEGFKNAPPGSKEFQIYEYYTIPFQTFLQKYFSSPDLTGYNILQHWGAAAESKSDEFISKWCNGELSNFDYERFLEVKKYLNSFPAIPFDLVQMIAFLAGDKMFNSTDQVFEWLNNRDWISYPEKCKENCYSPLELLELTNGANYIRAKFPTLTHWKFK